MNMPLRLFLHLFICLIFAGQSYATTAMSYGYEVNTVQPSAENLNNNGLINPSGCCSKSSSRDSQGQAQARAFFALAAGFVVPNSANAFSKVAPATAKQLQKKFKHAEDFGVSGNYNPANAKKFNEAIQNHLNSPGVKEISGSYRGNPVTFHTNPNTGLTVIQNPNGSFLSGWKLNPQQLQHVLKDGKL